MAHLSHFHPPTAVILTTALFYLQKIPWTWGIFHLFPWDQSTHMPGAKIHYDALDSIQFLKSIWNCHSCHVIVVLGCLIISYSLNYFIYKMFVAMLDHKNLLLSGFLVACCPFLWKCSVFFYTQHLWFIYLENAESSWLYSFQLVIKLSSEKVLFCFDLNFCLCNSFDLTKHFPSHFTVEWGCS